MELNNEFEYSKSYDYKQTSLFEFKRIRALNFTSDNKGINDTEPLFKVPKKRSGHRAVCNEENLWIWGGYNPIQIQEETAGQSPMLTELYRFNFATKKWMHLKTTGDVPTDTVASHATILYKCLMICWGGTGYPFGQKLDNSLFICNLKTLEWKKHKLKGEVPIPLYGSSIILVDNYLYIMFGTNSRIYTSNVYRINIETLFTECLFDSSKLLENASFRMQDELNIQYPDDFLMGRYRQDIILHERNIYVFGGGKSDGDSFPLSKLPVFNLDTNTWKFIDTHPETKNRSFPEKRKFHSCIKIDKFCYVFGGLFCDVVDDIFRSVENCVWRLNLTNLNWEKFDIKLPVNTYFHAACADNEGTVYIHGGIKDTSNGESFRQDRINHLYSINLKIPKLKELCWTFLTDNFLNVSKLSKEDLSEAGVTIPSNLMNRIN